MEIQQKPAPVAGMRVEWARFEDVPPGSRAYIESFLIPQHGDGELTIRNATESVVGWLVTLEQSGEPLRHHSGGHTAPQVELNWHYLRPV